MPKRQGVIERFVPRSEAGLAGPDCTSPLPIANVKRVFVHYTASHADRLDNHSGCAARWRGVQKFHMSASASDPSKPWCDVAYSVGVCRHGFALEGRWVGRRTGATGACNDDSYAIVFLGSDKVGRDDVGSLGREAIAECHAEFERLKGARLPALGHRDCGATACPGDELYSWIRSDAFRKLVNAQKVGGELVGVWQIRAGKKTLKTIRAETKSGQNGYQRIVVWLAENEKAVKAAEREFGAVKIRHAKVPA